MNTPDEKRNDPRYAYETPVIINARRTKNSYSGRLYNFSKKGMYIETDFECRAGDKISIFIQNPPDGSGPYAHEAKVTWSKKISEPVVLYRFACGAKIVRTVDYSRNRKDPPFKKRSGDNRRSGDDRRGGTCDRRQDSF